MYSIDEIISFVEKETGASKKEIKPGTDIFDDLGVCGDNFHELMADYSDRFKVDLSGYLWYFHCDEEGQNIGGVLFAPPYERVKRIPITPELLLRFANEGKWSINYPDHKLPKYRYDILIGMIFFLSLIFYSLYRLIK
jgi:hypothetical protein